MSIFNSILSLHIDWLRGKGYSEKMLDSTNPPGTFENSLKEQFEKAIIGSLWQDTPICHFNTTILGHVGPKGEVTSFFFAYSYDPRLVKLNLGLMEARMNESVSKIFPIGKPLDLLPPGKVYEALLHRQAEILLSEMQLSKSQHPLPKKKHSI